MKFVEPEETGGNRCYPKDIVNHLLLVWAIDYIAHSPTQYTRPDKPSDVIVVDVVDLDQVDEFTNQAGLVARRTWWRQSRLIQSLKPRLGNTDPMLVRMVKGMGSKGMNAPFELLSMTGDPGCVGRATAWLNSNHDFAPSSRLDHLFPEPPTQVEEPPAWAQPAPETALERMARLAQEPPRFQERQPLPPRQPTPEHPPY